MNQVFVVTASCLLAVACASSPSPPPESQGRAASYQPLTESGGSVGIEGQDIVAMTDRMAADLLREPTFVRATRPPRVIVDSAYFTNEGSTPINKNLITDRLRVELSRAANGRILFVGRENVAAVEQERELKRQGVAEGEVDPGGVAGADYRLTGRINTLDRVEPASGVRARYTQIVFEMIDLQKGYLVWSGLYEFQKSGQDDVIYQ